MPTTITTTVGTDGGDDYATLTAALADNFGATSRDLVANDEAIICEVGNDWTGDGLEDALVLGAGWVCDATRNITVRAQAGEGTDGTPGSGARWWQGGASTDPAIDIGDVPYVTVGGEGRGVEVRHYRSNVNVVQLGTTNNTLLDSCLVHRDVGTTTGCYFIGNTASANNRLRNCVFRQEGAVSPTYLVKCEGSGEADNCTLVSSSSGTVATGFWVRSSAQWQVRNTWVGGSGDYTDEWGVSSGFTAGSTHNGTSNASDNAPGADSQVGISSADVVDETDYLPAAAGKLQAGNGDDLSGTFNYDITGASRGGSFTLGAFHVAGASGPSITSIDGDDIVLDGANVTITGTALGNGNSTIIASPENDAGNGSAVAQPNQGGNATELTVTGNLSTFSEGQTLYLFVTDVDGGNLTNPTGHQFVRQDETAPTLGNVAVPSPTTDGGNITITASEDADAYWTVVGNVSLVGNATQVLAGLDSAGNAALDSGNSSISAGNDVVVGAASGLSGNTTYVVAVALDDGNNTSTVATGNFTTAVVTDPTITLPALKNNTGTLLADETGVVACVYAASTGALVSRLTGLTTNGSGVLEGLADAGNIALTTDYYVVVETSGGDRGLSETIQAA